MTELLGVLHPLWQPPDKWDLLTIYTWCLLVVTWAGEGALGGANAVEAKRKLSGPSLPKQLFLEIMARATGARRGKL